jgi:hypothetical protein
MKLAAFAALLLLAACGAEAPPSFGQADPGLTVGGDVRIGLRGTL